MSEQTSDLDEVVDKNIKIDKVFTDLLFEEQQFINNYLKDRKTQVAEELEAIKRKQDE